MRVVEPFCQEPPRVGDPFECDPMLRGYLERVLPPALRPDIEADAQSLARRIREELVPLQQSDRTSEPRLVNWDPWGRRIDRVEHTALWRSCERLAAERGLVAIAYERAHGAYSRVHQFVLVHLFAPFCDVYTCPLAMSDGAARILETAGNAALAARALPHLLSRDPARFWTSGQWMTESTGGSDVGLSETVAVRDPDGVWRLYGRKWFTSAAASQMALTLARPQGNGPGGRGLALFYVEPRDAEGRPRNLVVHRLKDKLGTRKVPTAEITLEGTPAELVGEPRDGVRAIAPMLTLTRTWNAVCAVSGMRHAVSLALDYARRRVAFGAPLARKPLHVETLADLAAETEAAFQLTFAAVELLGREEVGEANEAERRLLRLLVPLAKLVTGKQAVAVASEALECFGGAGYVEDTGLPVLLRDAQVLPIWEGTTNVLALDVLRALAREGGLAELVAHVEASERESSDPELRRAAGAAVQAVRGAARWFEGAAARGSESVEAGARRFALTLGRGFALARLVRQASWELERGRGRAAAAARRFAALGVDAVRELDPADAHTVLDAWG
ncbi:MAG: acyl-CoA dehydrogenase family protein [Myxococcales bacterium]|nr:acyl-CoA dehydrogenase family protein [Myxococcales bacterium]